MCDCKTINLNELVPLSLSDYLENIDVRDCEYMCHRHHPFFYYFAGIIQFNFKTIQDMIIHAYCHKPTNTLRIILNKKFLFCDSQLFNCGINKAWNKFNGRTDLITEVYEPLRGKLYKHDNFNNKIYHANKNIIKNLMDETFFQIESKI